MDLSAFFETQLKQALKHFHDLEWLESSSPLTSYYFLGPFLPTIGQGKEVQSPGQVLQQVIQQAAEQLWSQPAKTEPIPRSYEQFQRAIEQAQQQPESTRWVYVLLELRCFQRYIKPKRLADIWEIYLPGSRAEHYRDYDNAIAQLADQLLKQLQPTFRLETVATSQQVIGVEAQITQCIATMNARQSLCLHGPGGVGKSTLAAAAIEQGQFDGCFWFTIRPTLNDHLNSLLFMLGYFLHRQGASGLWQMLLFNAGKLDDLSLALSVTLADLNQLAHRRIVLCFDELELLQITDPERALATHSQILRFIEGLQGQAALLLISQRPTFHADRYIALTGLATPQIRHLLQPVGIELTDSDFNRSIITPMAIYGCSSWSEASCKEGWHCRHCWIALNRH